MMASLKIYGTQEMHCCGPEGADRLSQKVATWSVRAEDGGGGSYAVLVVDEWAFNDLGEFDRWARAVREAVKQAETFDCFAEFGDET